MTFLIPGTADCTTRVGGLLLAAEDGFHYGELGTLTA
jgi:hypothetical protein